MGTGTQLHAILASSAPEVWQQGSCPHKEGRMDLGPALVPCDQAVGAAQITHYAGLLCEEPRATLIHRMLFRRPLTA